MKELGVESESKDLHRRSVGSRGTATNLKRAPEAASLAQTQDYPLHLEVNLL